LNYLLDTNVVSEWAKLRPDAKVVRWLAETDEDRVCLSVITFAEVSQGIEKMAAGQRRDALRSWLGDDLAIRFEGRILAVDLAVARARGALMARSARIGINLNPIDAFFGATAEVYSLALVTRNTRHFEELGVPLVNPWESA
jgi:predicted nucleic acid-binding protein